MNEKSYRLLLADLDNHAEAMKHDRDYERFRRLVEDKAFTRSLIEEHGWALPDYTVLSGSRWVEISDNLAAAPFKEGSISWPDDDRQPSGEYLLCLRFSTGAYFFGEDYPTDLFQEFWRELVTLGPEYTDTQNHCLYFTPERGGVVTQRLGPLVSEYRRRYEGQKTQRRIEQLKAEIVKLESAP